MPLFQITRSLDYTVSQGFLVAADGPEDAREKVAEFVDGNWDAEASKEMGVVQVSDSMTQIDDSHGIVCDGENSVDASAAAIDPSLEKLLIGNHASEMFALIKKIATTPAMFHANVADLGASAYAMLEKMHAEIDESRQMVLEVTRQSKETSRPESERA